MNINLAAPADIGAAIELHEAAGFSFRIPALRAAMVGDITLADIYPGGRIATHLLWPQRRPVMLVVGDDCEPARGPTGFPQTARLIRWAAVTVLYSAGGEARHYAKAVDLARQYGRVLMIETCTARRAAWADLLQADISRRNRAGDPPMMVLDIRAAEARA